MSPLPGIYASQISGHLSGPSGAYDALASVTLSASASSITFAGIPSGYKHLQIRAMAMNPTGWDRFQITYNGTSVSSTYNDHLIQGTGAAVNAYSESSSAKVGGSNPTNPGVSIIDILDYANTNKYKTIRGLYGFDANGSGQVQFASVLWQSTSAITQINITSESSYNFNTYSQFALYGVK